MTYSRYGYEQTSLNERNKYAHNKYNRKLLEAIAQFTVSSGNIRLCQVGLDLNFAGCLGDAY